ncbi:lycopene cyclase family protein [Hyperthermus butylicus]|uniref:Dehydrogenase (Flavoprotein), FixC n=1 Tax=Hyperthermus butylicus (strain DSM 5456 / JCM 9403 / PLM1-5) TaxID=415426 RepID=A2BJ01_HYPBU|nr:lycopene cyclase family protein [Hyperthermus butylicus]ABM79962.1 putative dehydrogenase (flavoprotein), FixC [Hyperthermus butylicus DSM 5456]
MSDPRHQVLIVGGGAAGLSVAVRVSSDAVLVSASPRPGWPPHCTGLISPETLKLLSAHEAVSDTYRGAVFLDARLREVCRVERRRVLAYRVNRPLMEEVFAEEARARGVRMMFSKPVVHVDWLTGCAMLADGGRICGERVVLAPGYSPRFAMLFGAERCERLYGVEVRVVLARRMLDDVFYTIHGSIYTPEFFAWIVPVNAGREALIGLAARNKPLERLAALLDDLARRGVADYTRVVSRRNGIIVMGPAAKRITRGKLVGLGDVLCASKPFTGGGLYAISRLASLVAGYADNTIAYGELDAAWRLLRRELLLQRKLTKLLRVLLSSSLTKLVLAPICEAGSRGLCSLDYDRHSSAVSCLWKLYRLWGGGRVAEARAAEENS